jgi:hypothetical protein
MTAHTFSANGVGVKRAAMPFGDESEPSVDAFSTDGSSFRNRQPQHATVCPART